METHDILIGIVIILILAVQFAVFGNTQKKINLFKSVIPRPHSFSIVKVYIPESKIKSISTDEIFANEQRYSIGQTGNHEVEEDNGLYVMDDVDEESKFQDEEKFDDEYNEREDIHPETEIWITKGNEEKKITYNELNFYQESGWKIINWIAE